MTKSSVKFKQAKKVIASGVTSPVRYFEPYPFFVKRSDKCHMWTEDEQKITDMCCGYGALLLGHRRKEIMDAVAAQLKQGTLYCAPTQKETELATLIANNYLSIDKVRLVNTGGEATMTAIRIARGYTKKDKILKFDGCYHGAHDSVLVGAGSGATQYGIPASKGVPKETARNTLVAEYNDIDGLEHIIEKNAEDIACVIIEPIMANMGLVLPKKGFLQKLRKMTKQNEIVLIFDEVVTGFRMSAGGAQQYYNVKPDITTIAKALSNGFGIAAVGGEKKIMEYLAPNGPVYQASTFAGNPVSVSAAIASIKTINKLRNTMYAKLEKNCKQMARAVDDAATAYDIPHVTSHIGSMMQIFFTEKTDTIQNNTDALQCDKKKFQAFCTYLLKKYNVFVAPSQFEVTFLSNAHTTQDIERVTHAYEETLRHIATKYNKRSLQ